MNVSNIPEKVKVGGIAYEVRYVEKPTSNATMMYKVEEGCYAEVDYGKSIIFLDPHNGEQFNRECLVHEAIHALFSHSGVDYLLDRAGVDIEQVIKMLDNSLTNFLLDNTNFFEGEKSCLNT